MIPNRVAIIGADFPVYELYCPNFTGMQAGLKAMGIEHKLFGCRPTLDVQAVIDYSPDFVIYGLLDMIKNHSWRKMIREALPNAKIVMWYGDLRNNETGQISANVSELDMMFVSNDAQDSYYENKWKVPKCHFLPLGCQIYDREYEEKFDFDFVFIGGVITGAGFLDRARQMWKYRENGLKILDGDARHPNHRAKVMKSMPTIYRSSKVTLDQSHFTDIKGYTSNRFWIVTASGGFALTKRFPDCEKFYPPGTRAYFDTFSEAIRLMKYYLDHPAEREKIRKAGHQHAKNHTYEKRFEIMFEKVYAPTETKIDNARLGRVHKGVSPRTPLYEDPKIGTQEAQGKEGKISPEKG